MVPSHKKISALVSELEFRRERAILDFTGKLGMESLVSCAFLSSLTETEKGETSEVILQITAIFF